MTAISVQSAVKSFGRTKVLDDVSLDVAEGSITAILGQSGSGKTSLLRVIAGLEQLDAGRVEIGGRVMDDSRRAVHAQHRGVGYVPQDGALFPHLSVSGNIGFGLPRKARSKTAELIGLVGLEGLDKRYPHQLSGGQQQRVALARALAIEPKVVLLDEPFSRLDAALRESLRRDVVRILTETGTTTILVTHDQDEALSAADQIAVLDAGRIVACAGPRQLYRQPPDISAAGYLGQANILSAVVRSGAAHCELGQVSVADGLPEGPARLMLRPEQLILRGIPTGSAVAATVTDVQYYGHDALAQITLANPDREKLLARVSGDQDFTDGQNVWIHVEGQAQAWAVPAA